VCIPQKGGQIKLVYRVKIQFHKELFLFLSIHSTFHTHTDTHTHTNIVAAGAGQVLELGLPNINDGNSQKIKSGIELGAVAYVCNPSYLEGRDWEFQEQPRQKKSRDPHLSLNQ
jgi:hypothetical protein